MSIDRSSHVVSNSVRRSGINERLSTQVHSAPPNGDRTGGAYGPINISPLTGWTRLIEASFITHVLRNRSREVQKP
jgi:hypothetical protein